MKKIEMIDVREKEDYEKGHIPEAKSMPLSRLNEEVEKLPKDSSIVIVCNRGGKRSKEAFDLMKQKGFEDVRILEGGMEAYQKNKE